MQPFFNGVSASKIDARQKRLVFFPTIRDYLVPYRIEAYV